MDRKASRRTILAGGTSALVAGCIGLPDRNSPSLEPIVSFDAFDPAFFRVVETKGTPRLLGERFLWSEGPAWDPVGKALFFTDVPANTAYRWTNADGVRIFLRPSGGQGSTDGFREPGANGLLIDRTGNLILCNHGERALEVLDIATGVRRTLAGTYQGRRFNSPNDIVEAGDGTLYFTDPPYGLEGLDASPLKEMDVNGVYRVSRGGDVARIVDGLTFPNGLALTPDGHSLLISQSDPAAPHVYRLDLRSRQEPTLWFDASPYTEGHPGLPDGMAMAASGHLFLAGPGGILVLDTDGHCLGRIGTGRATANCAFGEDGRTLFVTARDRLLAIRTSVVGLGYKRA